MDESLQQHGFGDIGQTQDGSGVPAGVDEAEMIMGEGQVPIMDAPREDPDLLRQESNLRPGLPIRPVMRREGSVPAPHQPPPPAPPQSHPEGAHFGDPMALDTTRLTQEQLPGPDPSPYAYLYEDTDTLPYELEEWFSYGNEDRFMLMDTHRTFTGVITGHVPPEHVDGLTDQEGDPDWTACDAETKLNFLRRVLQGLKFSIVTQRTFYLGALLYIILGAWYDTAGTPGLPTSEEDESPSLKTWRTANEGSARQLQEIGNNVRLLIDNDGLIPVYEVLHNAISRLCSWDALDEDQTEVDRILDAHEAWFAMTIFYFCLEVTRCSPDITWKLEARQRFLALEPNLLIFMSEAMDKMRWDDTIDLSLTRLLLLYWKSAIVLFGSSEDADEAKMSFVDNDLETSDAKGQPIITASPLDYHLFRQEISAKYPAYNPPPPLFPLEPDNNSILPPLKPSLAKLSDMNAPGLASVQGHGTSLLHQPIHIATPAPSPPPSPAVGGKGGKKMNYQTNNQFPFLYPPLDETSNRLGGKGSTDLQDLLVGRKWEGSDIPASILEAAKLFATRMRASRAMKQLWEERVEFMKYERGWRGPDEDVAEETLDSETAGESNNRSRSHDGSIDDRLQTVEEFYRNGLPHLQSVVMVLLKVILANVTVLVTQINGQSGLQGGFQFQEGQNGDAQHKADTANGMNGAHTQSVPPTADELDSIRNQEITAKAVAGILILLLKWFKVSHILKYEYLTQLLVDANYIPLILKLMQTQEVERIVNARNDSNDHSFFRYCLVESRAGVPKIQSPVAPDDETSYIHQSSSEDEAAPPPIKRHRSPPKAAPPPPPTAAEATGSEGIIPLVDELGIPTTAFPTAPITNFSRRNFYSTITLLRILHKVCARHAHRNLLLVSYKSTPLLRRALKVPQPELRKYALKLVKAQVPFCGRKWRQANMRVITAVWLSIRPELRDEWLAGGDVDGMVEESVPREQAIRGLVHWWHLRRYWDVVGPPASFQEVLGDEVEEEEDANGIDSGEGERFEGLTNKKRTARTEERKRWLEEENDFFRRELERMEWNWGTGEDELDQADQQAAQQAQGQVWDAGVPIEGW